MANTTVGAQVQVEFASVGQMRKAIKEATSDLIAMQEQFGKTSPQAIEAARRIADLKDRIEDAKDQADLFDPGKKFQAFATAASQVAAGFSAVQGAMALVGAESEDVQQGLLKVQGALALSQGLSQLGDLEKSFSALNIMIAESSILQRANAAATTLTSGAMRALGISVNTTSTSFKVLKTAIVATGIGALVVAIGFAVEALMNLADSTDEATKAEKKLADQQKRTEEAIKLKNQALKDTIEFTDQVAQVAVKRAKLEGKSEDDIIKIQREALQKKIDLRKRDLETLDTSSEEFFQKKKEYGQALTDLENFELDQQLQRQEKGEAKKTKLQQDNTKKREDADKVLLDARLAKLSERQREEEKILMQFEERKKVLQSAGIKNFKTIEEQRDNELKALRKQFNDADLKLAEDFQKEFNKVKNDTRLAGIKDARLKEIEELKLGYEEQRKTINENENLTFTQRLILLASLKQKENQELSNIDTKHKEEESKRLAAAHENTRKIVAEQNAALLEAEINLQNQRFNAAQAGLQLLASLAGQNEKIANIIFAVQKGLEIARIIADTARGIVAAKAGLAAVPPFIGVAPNPAFILAAASAAKQIAGLKIAAAVGIAQIAGASIAKFKGGGGAGAGGGGGVDVAGGGGAPVSAEPTPTVTAQALNAQAINQLGNQSMRAYILNSDMQNNEQRNAYLERNARLG